MKKRSFLLIPVLILLFSLSSCVDFTEEAEKRINELKGKTDKLDSLINREVDKVLALDSLINKESLKVKKLDSLIDKSATKIDSVSKEKIRLIEELMN